VSFWRGPGAAGEDRRKRALDLLQTVAQGAGFEVTETFVSRNMCQAMVTSNAALLARITQIDYVSKVERPPEFQLAQIIESYDYGEKAAHGPTGPGANGIAVIDTGVINHPLLEGVLGEGINKPPMRDDARSHGTQVAGMAAYGSVEDCINSSSFRPEVWIYSVQLVREAPGGKVASPLLGTELADCIGRLKRKHRACRVANVSVIEEKSELCGGTQAELSAAIDEMSNHYKDMIFVVATGNTSGKPAKMGLSYPDHLFADAPRHGILAPGTSSHAITVGSIRKPSGQHEYEPSSITRVGPGIDGAIKPELVHVGGDLNYPILVLNPSYREKWFATSAGTSLSAPVVSNYVARMLNLFPDASRNLIVALLLSSATLPTNLPKPFSPTKQKDYASVSNVYGYGMPDLDRASYSDSRRVVLKHEGKLLVGHVEYFSIRIPQEFSQTRGRRTISVTLAFDPPCDPQESHYTGTRMEFHMYANHTLADVQKKRAITDTPEDAAPGSSGRSSKKTQKSDLPCVKMFPGAHVRKRTNHQKGVHTTPLKTDIDPKFPLVLAVECESMWEEPGIAEQPFSVVVAMAHEAMPDLYELVRALNPGRARAR